MLDRTRPTTPLYVGRWLVAESYAPGSETFTRPPDLTLDVVLGVTAVVVSAVGYFFSIITVFTTVMTFMALLIGAFNHSTFEKVRHYPHPRPIIEQTVTPTTPTNPEPHHLLVAHRTNEATPAKDLSAKDLDTKSFRAVSIAKADAEKRRSERENKPERPAHFHKSKVLTRQHENYDGHGYAMALGYAEGYRPGLDGQR